MVRTNQGWLYLTVQKWHLMQLQIASAQCAAVLTSVVIRYLQTPCGLILRTKSWKEARILANLLVTLVTTWIASLPHPPAQCVRFCPIVRQARTWTAHVHTARPIRCVNYVLLTLGRPLQEQARVRARLAVADGLTLEKARLRPRSVFPV